MKSLKLTAALLAMALLVSSCSEPARPADEPYVVTAAVLYSGDAVSWLGWQQSSLVNLTVETLEVDGEIPGIGNYDVLYLDKSLSEYRDPDVLRTSIDAYVKNGGAVFLDNAFNSIFSLDFLGASEVVKLDALPSTLALSNERKDYNGLRNVVSDFYTLYREYEDYDALAELDYGTMLVCDTAEPLVSVKRGEDDNPALYALNRYGKGLVYFTNPLLPNLFSDAPSTVSANKTIFNEFAALVSREKYGFSAERVFGSFGRPSIAWERIDDNSISELSAEYDLPLDTEPETPVSYTWDDEWQNMPEAVLSLPQRAESGGTMTLGAPTYIRSENYTWLSIAGRNEIPILASLNPILTDTMENDIQTVAAFARRFVYNPVTEEQLAKTVAAAYNMNVTITGGFDTGGFTFAPSAEPNSPYDACAGLKVTFSDNIMSFDVSTDADVYHWFNGSLYIGLNKTVTVTETDTPKETAHITRINLPAEITQTQSGAEVTFLEGGMMQLVVADGLCRTFSEGWETRHTSEGVVFTKFGEPSVIELHWDAADHYGEQ